MAGGTPALLFGGVRALLALLALALLPAACGAPQTAVAPLPAPSPGSFQAQDVFTAVEDVPDLRARLLDSAAGELEATYVNAELDELEGHLRRAYERFAEVVASAPNTLLGAVSALRLVDLQRNVPGASERILELVDELRHTTLHPLTAIYFNRLLVEARRYETEHSGSADVGAFSAEEDGLPDRWRWTGPFSYRSNLHLDRPEPFDSDAVLADEYVVAGRSLTTRLLAAHETSVGASLPSAGTYVFECWVHVDAAAERLAVLEAPDAALLSIDGEPLLRRTLTGAYQPIRLIRPVVLQPGWHRVRLRLGAQSGHAEFRFRLVAVNRDGVAMRIEPSPPESGAMSALEVMPALRLDQLLPRSVLEPAGPAESFVLMRLAADFGAEQLGEVAHSQLTAEEGVSSLTAMAVSDWASRQMSRAPSYRDSLQMQWARYAADNAPTAGGALLRLAVLLAESGREDEALARFLPLVERLALEPTVAISLYRLYSSRGFQELAEQALEHLLELAPDSCVGVDELAHAYTQRLHYPPLDALPPGFTHCEGGVRYHVDQHLLPTGRIDEALGALTALANRYPNDTHYRRRLFHLLMQQGRFDEAHEQIALAAQFSMDEVEQALLESDWLLAQGRTDEASERVRTALRGDAPQSYDLLRLASLIERTGLLDELRVDTLAAIEAYRVRGGEAHAGAAYALDYGAYRHFENGAGVGITHQIIHVLSRDALGTYGEVTVPGGSVLLRARTIKSDGRILEPDDHPGKDSISVPNLEVGDFVEIEYFDVFSPMSVRADAVVGSRWYFQIPGAPLSTSHLVVEVPSSWSQLVLDVRAGAPQPEVSERGGFRTYHFIVDGSRAPPEEPIAPSYDELLPSVRYAHGVGWEDLQEVYAERAVTSVRVTPEIEARTAALVAGLESPRERTRAIFRFVVDEIEETGGFLSGHANWTLHLGEGERLPLLLAMLKVAGLSYDLVFLKGWEDDQLPSEIPDTETYPYTVVRVRTEDDTRAEAEAAGMWLYLQDHAVFDYLPPNVQGTDGLVMLSDAGGPVTHVESPVWPRETSLQLIEVSLTIDEHGDATGVIHEQVPLRSASLLRSYLEVLQDQRELVREVEGGLSSSFPGIVVTSLEVAGEESHDQPVRLSYQFEVPAFAEVAGDRLVLDRRIFDRGLWPSFGNQPERQFPLSITTSLEEELTLRIDLPEGFRFTEVPEEVEVDALGLQYRWSVAGGGVNEPAITLARTTTLPVTRLAPDEYPVLVEALRRIDRAEALHLTAER